MKKILISVLILLVFSVSMISAQESRAPANFRMNIAKNQWSPGYQWGETPSWLMNGWQLQAGDKLEVELTFTSNAAIPELQICFVDNSERAPGWWGELSEWIAMENIPANTPFTWKGVVDITASASSAVRAANKMIFDYEQPGRAVTLTFSTFVVKKL